MPKKDELEPRHERFQGESQQDLDMPETTDAEEEEAGNWLDEQLAQWDRAHKAGEE